MHHAVASALTLRRYDRTRPIALVCTKAHKDILLTQKKAKALFDYIYVIKEEYASIVGFKHNTHKFLFYEENIFIDSDIIWCKNPDNLWASFSAYSFTTTGVLKADPFFGAAKGLANLWSQLFKSRQRTLKRFGLTYLSRVHSGVMYAKDYQTTKKVALLAQEMLQQIDKTHFRSRLKEKGRKLESCEWSLAMAMSKLNIPVYPWLIGQDSAQLDYIGNYTLHDEKFEEVKCLFYTDMLVYTLRGTKPIWLRKLLTKIFTILPGKGDYLYVTPYCLHFGWLHEKQPFLDFAEQTWDKIMEESEQKRLVPAEQ